jgi:rhodanese-related sulfurtransferase
MATSLTLRVIILAGAGFLVGLADSVARPVAAKAPEPKPTQSVPPQPAPGPSPNTPAAAPSAATATPTPTTPAAAELKPGHIDVAAAWKYYSENGYPFVDARSRAEFETGHIPEAFHLPVEAFKDDPDLVKKVFDQLDPENPVIVYCGGGECHASETVKTYLDGARFKQVLILEGGFPAWQTVGHKIETGAGNN